MIELKFHEQWIEHKLNSYHAKYWIINNRFRYQYFCLVTILHTWSSTIFSHTHTYTTCKKYIVQHSCVCWWGILFTNWNACKRAQAERITHYIQWHDSHNKPSTIFLDVRMKITCVYIRIRAKRSDYILRVPLFEKNNYRTIKWWSLHIINNSISSIAEARTGGRAMPPSLSYFRGSIHDPNVWFWIFCKQTFAIFCVPCFWIFCGLVRIHLCFHLKCAYYLRNTSLFVFVFVYRCEEQLVGDTPLFHRCFHAERHDDGKTTLNVSGAQLLLLHI